MMVTRKNGGKITNQPTGTVNTRVQPLIEFSHSVTTYVFKGRKLPKPDPSTYDAAHFTPPDCEIFQVNIYDGGSWSLCRGEVVFETGDGGSRSKGFAETVVLKYIEKMDKYLVPPF